jgi:F-box protein 20
MRNDRNSQVFSTACPFVFQVSQENVEYIPTRITKVTAPKPAANPLQFIKVGPASLYKSAQEQLKKVEEIKKVTKEVRDEAEDWQSVSDALNVLK